jgi:tetratricopeptide (TPR) repeat protein
MSLTPTSASQASYRWLKLQAVFWLALGQTARARAKFDHLLALWPSDAYGLSSRAHLLAQMNQPDEAIADLQALVTAHPKRSAADWFNLAFMLEARELLADAEAAFRRALALDDKLDRAWYGLGLVLIRLERPSEALPALRRNTELQPMSPYGWYQMARLHASAQRSEEALRIIRHLKGFEPKVAAQLERETGLSG